MFAVVCGDDNDDVNDDDDDDDDVGVGVDVRWVRHHAICLLDPHSAADYHYARE